MVKNAQVWQANFHIPKENVYLDNEMTIQLTEKPGAIIRHCLIVDNSQIKIVWIPANAQAKQKDLEWRQKELE
jgi:hypothetical protein